MTPDEIRQRLGAHRATPERYTNHVGLVYTEGVRDMADMCKANWLLDAIGCFQKRRPVKKVNVQEWFVKRCTDGWAVYMLDEEGDTRAFLELKHTDFPLPILALVFEHKVLRLKTEAGT